MTATHDAWPSKLYDAIAPLLQQYRDSKRTLASLTEEAASNKTLRSSPRYNDDMRVRDGVLGRGGAQILPLAAQWAVTEENLNAKIAELANWTCAMVFSGQRKGKPYRIDFTLMHCANAVPLVAAAAHHPDVPGHAKVELIRRLANYALVTFVGQGSPDMRFDLLRNFTPKKPANEWKELTERVFHVPDDGHIIKLLRALRYAEEQTKEVGDQEGYLLRGQDWLKAGNMLVEIAERKGDTKFVGGSGFDEGWNQ
jgi:Questin oxidase-like